MKPLSYLLLTLLFLGSGGCDAPDDLDGDAVPGLILDQSLSIISQQGGPHIFRIEVVDDDEERARGLMFRREMAPDAGMLFDFGEDRPVSMWMKNTYIPLDMLFIKSDGTIITIEQLTEPHSLKSIPSRFPVRAVLELNGGTVAQLQIKLGDRVSHALFGPS